MVFVPLRDENPLRVIRWQWVTMGLIVVNTVIFALTVYFQNFTNAEQSIAGSFAEVPVELLNSGFGPARGRYDSLAVPEPLTLDHVPVPPRQPASSRRQHAVPVGVRRQHRRCDGALQVPRVLPPVRRCRRARACRHVAGFAGAADRRFGCGCRRDRGLPCPASAGARVGARLPLHSAAHQRHVGARRLGDHADRHAVHSRYRPRRVVGAHRRAHRWRVADRVHAAAGNAAVRSGPSG